MKDNSFADLWEGNERVANIYWEHRELLPTLHYTIQSCGLIRAEYPGFDIQEAMKFVEAQYILMRGE